MLIQEGQSVPVRTWFEPGAHSTAPTDNAAKVLDGMSIEDMNATIEAAVSQGEAEARRLQDEREQVVGMSEAMKRSALLRSLKVAEEEAMGQASLVEEMIEYQKQRLSRAEERTACDGSAALAAVAEAWEAQDGGYDAILGFSAGAAVAALAAAHHARSSALK